ncbi:MAG: hypothetical protein H7Y04_10645 [Verrucomicrobia bacterium]|nr:hypothetical protein [Cytophagales bacterium]
MKKFFPLSMVMVCIALVQCQQKTEKPACEKKWVSLYVFNNSGIVNIDSSGMRLKIPGGYDHVFIKPIGNKILKGDFELTASFENYSVQPYSQNTLMSSFRIEVSNVENPFNNDKNITSHWFGGGIGGLPADNDSGVNFRVTGDKTFIVLSAEEVKKFGTMTIKRQGKVISSTITVGQSTLTQRNENFTMEDLTFYISAMLEWGNNQNVTVRNISIKDKDGNIIFSDDFACNSLQD